MKGIVFAEFLQFIENSYGYKQVDSIIESADLSTDGSYTSVGSYPFTEMVSLLVESSRITKKSHSELLRLFGHHLFKVFLDGYRQFFEGVESSFEIFSTLESKIHPDVRKLYPDAELPRFEVEKMNDRSMILVYRSSRKMSDFALGLIEACMEHFDEQGIIQSQKLDPDGEVVRFVIKRGA
ncbi:MAG: heme NO-binding domain-containing protein [Cyclobacteriaceae bacterium]